VSIGAAVFPRDGDSSEALMAAADARMYQDKHRWREQAARQGEPMPTVPCPPLHKM
jgi:GGDEF domain-containing protein